MMMIDFVNQSVRPGRRDNENVSEGLGACERGRRTREQATFNERVIVHLRRPVGAPSGSGWVWLLSIVNDRLALYYLDILVLSDTMPLWRGCLIYLDKCCKNSNFCLWLTLEAQ